MVVLYAFLFISFFFFKQTRKDQIDVGLAEWSSAQERAILLEFPRVPFVNCRQFMLYNSSPLSFKGGVWDLTVLVSDNTSSCFYF